MQKESRAARNAALKILLAGSSILAGAFAYAPAAVAQAGASSNDEIVVTARRREESAQDVSISVTALGAQRLEEAGVQDATDLQELAPGLAFTQGSDSRQNAAFNIRGVGQAFGGNLPSVLTYFADVPLDYHGAATFALYDLRSLQVLRGPQGTLFGRNTTGGAVLLVPQAPGGEFDGRVSVTGGDYDTFNFDGAVDLPSIGPFSMRLAANYQSRGGTSTNVFTGEDLDDRNQASWRGFIRFDPGGSFTNDLIIQGMTANEAGSAYVLHAVRPNGSTAGTASSMDRALQQLYGDVSGTAFYFRDQAARGIRNTEANSGGGMDRDIFLAVNTSTLELSDNLTIKNIIGYERLETGYTTDIDGTRTLVNYSQAQLGPPETSLRQISDELQLIGTAFDDRLNWVTGLFYLQSETPGEGFVNGRESLSNFQHTPIPGTDIDGVVHGTATSTVFSLSRNSLDSYDRSYAGYAQGTFAITDQLNFTAGGRYTWDTRRSTFGQMSTINGVTFTCASSTGLPASTPQDQCLRTLNDGFEGYGYTFAVDWHPTEDVMLYATTRRNFKAGGQNFINTLTTGLLSYQPETAIDYEIGIKSDWDFGFLSGRTNIAIYHADYEDMQRQVTANNGGAVSTIIFNAASATIEGFEVESIFHLTDNLDFSLFYNFTDAHYNEFIEPSSGADLSSNGLVGTPERSGGATLRYQQPLGEIGNFVGSISYYAQTDMEVTANQIQNPFINSPSYELFNARIGLQNIAGRGVDISIWGNNLTDEEYIVAGLGLYGTTLGYNSVVYGDPQMFGIDVTYRFPSR